MINSSWSKAFSTVLDVYRQSGADIDWIIVGSVGSVLQGCEMEPGDLDIYTQSTTDTAQFAKMLERFALPERSAHPHGEDWLSSVEEPIFTQTFPWGFSWSKGKWLIDGFKVEVVNISESGGIPDSLDGDGIWEGGRYIWPLRKLVPFGDGLIPTVPLEIQLESNLRRQRADRVDAIINAMRRHGYDRQLLEQALSAEHLAYFRANIHLP